jgi:crotonobetainyl-CoA:carnitine CoA-transferase CaiB-like acyl-CoA transferase
MNKKSVTLDLRSEEGKAQLHQLVQSAEVVMNNLRGDLPAKMGLDYAAMSKVKPSIVCVHISAYGRDNERAAWPVTTTSCRRKRDSWPSRASPTARPHASAPLRWSIT